MNDIRMMTSLDLDRVVQIEQACSVDPWPRTIFAACLDRHQCYVLTENRKIIGFGILMFADVECQILNIAIAPEVQNQGKGKYLLRDLIESARLERARELILEVRASNLPAKSLYSKMGFVPVGHRKDYYQTPTGREDADVMLLTL